MPTGAAPPSRAALRGKMLDVEDELQKNGFSDSNDEKHGDFSTMAPRVRLWSRRS